jgi:hypothetical protein
VTTIDFLNDVKHSDIDREDLTDLEDNLKIRIDSLMVGTLLRNFSDPSDILAVLIVINKNKNDIHTDSLIQNSWGQEDKVMFNLMRMFAGPILAKTCETHELELVLNNYASVLTYGSRLQKFESPINWLKEISAIVKEIFCSNAAAFYFVGAAGLVGLDKAGKGLTRRGFTDSIVNKVRADRRPYYCKEAASDVNFNPLIDIDTQLPVLTYPILKYDESSGFDRKIFLEQASPSFSELNSDLEFTDHCRICKIRLITSEIFRSGICQIRNSTVKTNQIKISENLPITHSLKNSIR